MKKRILQIYNSLGIGGIENIIIQLSNKVDNNCFSIFTCSLTDDYSNSKKLNDYVVFHSFNFKSSKFTGIKFLLRYPYYIFKIGRYLKRIKPDIIHIHSYNLVYLLIAISAKLYLKNVLIIRTVHTSGLYYSSQSFYSKIQIQIEKLATRINKTIIVGISKQVFDICNNLFSKSAYQIKLIYNGINIKEFEKDYSNNESRKKYANENDFIAIYVARFDDGKNHDFLIHLWTDIIKIDNNIKLLLVGDGRNYESVKKLAEELDIKDYVIFTGRSYEVNKLLNISDIALFPSSFEGFGIALIEKMAAGLPVIVSDIPSFREVVSNGENGFIIPIENKKLWINTILKLKSSIEYREIISNNAKLRSQCFSIDKTIDQYESLYKKGF